MNFGFPFTPFQAQNVSQDFVDTTTTTQTTGGYMGNQLTQPYMQQQVMPASGCSCGCNPTTVSQVVSKCYVEDMPYYVNYHTHCVNNVVRRHIQIPTYSTSEETVYYDEWQTNCPNR